MAEFLFLNIVKHDGFDWLAMFLQRLRYVKSYTKSFI